MFTLILEILICTEVQGIQGAQLLEFLIPVNLAAL